jgi:uncharacterized protein YgiM (DUF1202 family)
MSIRSSFTLVMSLGIILVVSMACVPRTPELPVMTEPLSTVTPQIGETPTPEPMAGAPKEERTAAPVEPQLTAVQNMNVRSGPGVQYLVVGYLPEGKRAIIIGRAPDVLWWKIECPADVTGDECWISGKEQYTQAENADGVPIAAVSPLPTPLESAAQPEPTMAVPVKLEITPGAVPPSDVLEQVDFSVPTAGIFRCMSSEASEIIEEMVEVGEPVTWCACGFEEGEEFLVRVINPKGETVVKLERTAEKTVFGDTCQEGLLSRNTFLPDDPLGQYRVEIVGQDSTLTLTFTLMPASHPTILSTGTGYVLAGFHPFERVRLLGFDPSFVGEWWVEVDEGGILYVDVDTSVKMYAIGTESGEAPPYTADGEHSFSQRWVNYEGELAYGAAVDATDQLSIRSVPSLSGDLVATVPAGTRMQIVSEPIGNNDTFWWTVMLWDGTSGWADENWLRLVDYEPNDTLETAASLFLFPPEDFQASFWASALRIDPGDEDWFALPLVAGQRIDIYVMSELMELELGELGVALYSSDGRPLAGGRKMDFMLSLDLETAQSDTYYLRIYGQTGSEEDTYTIVIDSE